MVMFNIMGLTCESRDYRSGFQAYNLFTLKSRRESFDSKFIIGYYPVLLVPRLSLSPLLIEYSITSFQKASISRCVLEDGPCFVLISRVR